jgi:hypothetical protein
MHGEVVPSGFTLVAGVFSDSLGSALGSSGMGAGKAGRGRQSSTRPECPTVPRARDGDGIESNACDPVCVLVRVGAWEAADGAMGFCES